MLSYFSKKEFAVVSNLRFLAGKISRFAELSMKKSFITSGPRFTMFAAHAFTQTNM